MPLELPPLLTAGNALATIKAVLAEEGYTGPVLLEEGAGWVRVSVAPGIPEQGLRRAVERLAPIVNAGVAFEIVRLR